MPLTRDQAQHLAAVIADLRPGDWTEKQLMTVFGRNQKHPAPLAEISTAAINAARDKTIRSPDVIFMAGAHWNTTDTATTAGKPEPCPAHPDDRNGIHNCTGCWSEIKTGDRPRAHYGKRYEPLDGPDPALRANPHHQTPTPNATESNLPAKHPHPGTRVPPTHF